MSEPTHMPRTRRVVTGHTPDGKAIISSDQILTPADPTSAEGKPPTGITVGFTNLFRTEGYPATNVLGDYTDWSGKMMPLTDGKGVACRIVDFPPLPPNAPDNLNIMHRTVSIDFGVLLSGSITMVLDDGVSVDLNEGDVVVQRATIHHWKNDSGKNCRILFVLVPSQEVEYQNEQGEKAVLPPTNMGLMEGGTKKYER